MDWVRVVFLALVGQDGPVYGCAILPTMEPMLITFPLAAMRLGAKAWVTARTEKTFRS